MRQQGRGNARRQGRGRKRGQAKILHIACLVQLQQQDLHGYELLQGLDDFLSLNSDMDPSIIYRVMRDFEDNDLVTSYEGQTSKGPQRRMYTLTQTGSEQLASWILELERMRADIDTLLGVYGKTKKQ